MLSKNNKSHSQSLVDPQRQPLPFLEKKKIGAEAYVSERINRIRLERSKQKDRINVNESTDGKFEKRWKELDQIRQMKKNLILSTNKVVSTDQILSTFQPFRKELDLMRQRPNAAIHYDDLLSNLQPFSAAIKELGVYRVSNNRQKIKRKSSQMPARVNLYRSISKRHNQRERASQHYLKSEESYFLNVGKMSLLDAEQKLQRKSDFNSSNCMSPDKRFSSMSAEVSDFKDQLNEAREDVRNLDAMTQPEDSVPETIEPVEEVSPFKLPQIGNNAKDLSPYRRKKKFIAPFETYYYRTMIWKVNLSNKMYVEVPQQYEHRVRVYIGKGNNSSLVRALIKRRIWIGVTDRIQEANFVWTQLKSLPFFKLQSPYVEGSPSQQKQSQIDLLDHYNSKLKYIARQDQKKWRRYMQKAQALEERTDQRFLCRNKYFDYELQIKTENIRLTKMQNHLINNYIIGNKKALFHTMSVYYSERGQEVFDYLPLTFHVKQGLEDQVYYKFLKYYYKLAKESRTDSKEKSKNIWIVKPGENSNRGSGIKVCLNLEEIKAILKKKELYSDGSYRTWIVQSYIEKPLLYHRRKFDIRHYMMISCVNGIVKGYWYKEGYCRTTSSEYTVGTNCSKIHLTNDAVQKNLPDYGKYEKGNKLSYDQLEAYIEKLTSKRKNPISFRQSILPKMKKIATDAIRACSGSIDPERRGNNFEIFGLDFMIDSDYKLYLIEINTNPCLELSCPLLSSIIPRFIENTLEITLDTQFPPPVRYCPKGLHYFKNLEQQNRYELVYDSRVEKLFTCGTTVLDEKLLEEEDDTFEDDGDEYQPDE